jgi:hypothetical protein
MTLETGRRCGTENRRNPRRANQSQENLRYCIYDIGMYYMIWLVASNPWKTVVV